MLLGQRLTGSRESQVVADSQHSPRTADAPHEDWFYCATFLLVEHDHELSCSTTLESLRHPRKRANRMLQHAVSLLMLLDEGGGALHGRRRTSGLCGCHPCRWLGRPQLQVRVQNE